MLKQVMSWIAFDVNPFIGGHTLKESRVVTRLSFVTLRCKRVV
jgi:hypothetical protein